MKKKFGLAAITLTMGLALTGCFGGSEEPNQPVGQVKPGASNPTDTTSPTATPSPSDIELNQDQEALELTEPTSVASPTESQREYSDADKQYRDGYNTALDVNFDEMLEKYTKPDVREVFTSDEELREGAEFAQQFYYDLVSMGDFYQEREGTNDYDLINNSEFTNRMSKNLLEGLEKKAKDSNGTFMTTLPIANAQGGISQNPGGGEDLKAVDIPMSVWGTPTLDIGKDSSGGETLVLKAERDITWRLTEGYSIKQDTTYTVHVVPSSDSWYVVDFYHTTDDVTVTKGE